MPRSPLLLLGLAGAAVLSALPQAAPAQGRDRVLVIYGTDKCPTSNGEEIVVCSRKPESERYRIPEELRNAGGSLPPGWSKNAKSLEYVGASGINSCSPAGSGGASGCLRQMIQQARDERRANR